MLLKRPVLRFTVSFVKLKLKVFHELSAEPKSFQVIHNVRINCFMHENIKSSLPWEEGFVVLDGGEVGTNGGESVEFLTQ